MFRAEGVKAGKPREPGADSARRVFGRWHVGCSWAIYYCNEEANDTTLYINIYYTIFVFFFILNEHTIIGRGYIDDEVND